MGIKSTQLATGSLLVGYMLCGQTVHGATFFVAKTGQNANSCAQAQSQSTPKLTINNAVGCLAPGDTLLVRGGTYDETLINNVPSGSSWTNKVRIAAYQGETVWLRPTSNTYWVIYFANPGIQYIEFDGINIDGRGLPPGTTANMIKIEWSLGTGGPHHIRFQNLEIIGTPGTNVVGQASVNILLVGAVTGSFGANEFINVTVHGGGEAGRMAYGFYVQSSDNLIQGCDIYDVSGYGVHLYNGYQGLTARNNIVRNNRIHDIHRSGDTRMTGIIDADNVSGTKIYNNLLYNIGTAGSIGAGIDVYSSSSSEVYNNTIYGSAAGGIVVDPYASGAIVTNNISYNNAGGNYSDAGSGTVARSNLFGIDPLFVSPSNADFQLRSTSAAIDTGVALSVVTTDLNGNKRPQGTAYDIGAFEFGSASQTSVPAPPTGVRIVSN
jgi:hypothetical protein